MIRHPKAHKRLKDAEVVADRSATFLQRSSLPSGILLEGTARRAHECKFRFDIAALTTPTASNLQRAAGLTPRGRCQSNRRAGYIYVQLCNCARKSVSLLRFFLLDAASRSLLTLRVSKCNLPVQDGS